MGLIIFVSDINNGICLNFGYWIGHNITVTLPLAYNNSWIITTSVVSVANGQLSCSVANKTGTSFQAFAFINNGVYSGAGCNYITIGY